MGRNQNLRVWDLHQPVTVASGRNQGGHESPIGALAFSPHNHWLVSGDRKGTVLLREWLDGTGTRVLSLPGHTDRLRAFAFSAGGRWLASGGYDRTVRLWDLSAPDPARGDRLLAGHTHWVLALAFSRDERLLLSGGLDDTIRLWNLTGPLSSAALQLNGSWATDMVLDPERKWLLARLESSSATGVQIFDLRLDRLLAAAETYAGRNLTQRAAYLGLADKYCGPLLCRPRGVNQAPQEGGQRD